MAFVSAIYENAGWGLLVATRPALSATQKECAMDNAGCNVEQEVWEDIPDWAGVYQASSHGNIRSVPRTKRHKSRNGDWFDMPLKGRILRPGTHENGYKIVALSDVATGRKPRTYRVHRLVCLAFHGLPVGERCEAAHNNGIRDDNRATNLRWATHAENMADIRKHKEQALGLG